MNELTRWVLLALVAVGCSSAPKVPRHEFDPADIGLLKKSFVEVVRKNYGGRDDGTLSDATFVEHFDWAWTGAMQKDLNSMRFVFHHYTPVDGAHSEMVDLVFKRVAVRGRTRYPGQVSGTPVTYRHVFRVLVHLAKQGADPVLKEKSAQLVAEIKAKMAGRGGTSPSNP